MATVATSLQGTSPTVIDATDILQFAGAAFNGAISINSYNDTTHVKTSGGSNKSSGNTPKNNKFISQSGGSGGKSQVDVGSGTVLLDSVANANAALKINFSHGSAVALSGSKFYAYDGITPATAPTDVDIRAAEVGNTNFTQAEGSGSPLNLVDKTAATSHDFFIILSASPLSVNLKSFKFRFETIYQ